MVVTITPLDKLIKRILREFPHKILIGDILIDDAEFELITHYFKQKYRYMVRRKQFDIFDRIFCVALIQIGIRFYDGKFWPHVEQILDFPDFNGSHQGWIRESYNKTLKKHGKIIDDSGGISGILLHGFVSNIYADRFFDFLFAFYKLDLERDIGRFNTEMMNDLIDIMIRMTIQGVRITSLSIQLMPFVKILVVAKPGFAAILNLSIKHFGVNLFPKTP